MTNAINYTEALVLLAMGLLFSGCATAIPKEYRYYSHQSKSLLDLDADRRACWIEQEDRTGKVDWVKIDACLADSGWKRRSP
jgi:starvation-inducible outer membrane lipoprotein